MGAPLISFPSCLQRLRAGKGHLDHENHAIHRTQRQDHENHRRIQASYLPRGNKHVHVIRGNRLQIILQDDNVTLDPRYGSRPFYSPLDNQVPHSLIGSGTYLRKMMYLGKFGDFLRGLLETKKESIIEPQPKPSANPPETINTHSDDVAEPMEVDKAPMGRTLRKRKGKVAKHLKREANERKMESFQKKVFRIPLEKPFEEAYFTHRLWIFFRETRETEEDIKRMFCEAKEKMKNRITLKKKSNLGKFSVPCTVKGIEFPHAMCDTGASVSILPRSSGGLVRDLEVQIGNALVPIDLHGLDIKLNWNSSLLLGIDDPGLIEACHCGVEYETEYSALIKTHTATSIDNANQKSIDFPKEESIDSSPGEWKNDYYNPIMAAHTRDTMHT
ncbi:hypothetical protein DY000_02021885 [Brassica cretica]|uniref:Aspartic peptidase DDI1-type domain-containing protein n=1 Tax=Brassica cretica TaxID=69181 RepID=A0ABQ7E880_BRACR|nr:hypothetical protein DY000_02021885 [Brassica cretica]